MVDPLTLSAIGGAAVTEGIKFLYAQAGEVLKRWREQKEAAKNTTKLHDQTEPITIKLPAILEGQLITPEIHFDAVERLEEQLREVRRSLSDFADGTETVDLTDEHLLRSVDALRRILEVVYQQRLTFKGEQRLPSGSMVVSNINVEDVAGYVAAVRARRIGGDVRVEAQTKRVEPGAQFIGIDTDTIG